MMKGPNLIRGTLGNLPTSRSRSRVALSPIYGRCEQLRRPYRLQCFSSTADRRSGSATVAQSLPRVAQASTWKKLVPRFIRERAAGAAGNRPASKEWNPATFYIVIFLFIGSQAIHIIALQTESTAFIRKADTRIGLLKEAIQRVKNGENVDVERLLGTGDAAREKEWEECKTFVRIDIWSCAS